MVKSVEKVKVTGLYPMFKDGVEATSIQLVSFSFDNGDECGFKIVAQKGLYEVGTDAIYIQPDYCLSSDVELFHSFTQPGGNPNKSRLGKMNRVRAIKFNFNESLDTMDPIYSNGILLPLSEVKSFLEVDSVDGLDLADVLQVTKYEEPEKLGNGQSGGDFPEMFYKTDETNIMNVVSHVKRVIEKGNGNVTFGVAIKRDGSSFSQFTRVNADGVFYNTICSRSQTKRSDTKQTIGYKNEVEEYGKYFNQETKKLEWRGKVTGTMISEEDALNTLTPIQVEISDAWIELSKRSGLFEGALEYCKKYNVELGFRGEIYGAGLKGSGNKVNPDAKEKSQLRLFGIDKLEFGHAVRQHYGNEHNLKKVAEEIGVQYTEVYEVTPKTFEDLLDFGRKIFADEKANGRIIEGVVIRTMYSNDVSCKFMNDEYDAAK